MNTAEYLVKKLEELDINDFFGVPGDYNFNLLYAVNNNPNTKFIGCTNELNAGYAADGYARIKGYGAVITTYGVGELSAINAIAGSYAENIPVIHIVGLPSTKNIEQKKSVHHNLFDVNYRAFYDAYKSVTAGVAFLAKDNAKPEIDRVIKILIKEKKPVYIAIPDDIATMEISDRVVSMDYFSNKDVLKEVSEKIAEKIKQAKKPVILGDALVKRYDACIEYKEFAEKSGLPVTNFIMGMDLIDMDYEKYVGGYFASYKNQIAQKYLEDTDCLIAVGPIYSDLNSLGFNLPYKINNHIAIYGNYSYVDGKKYSGVKMADVLESVTSLISAREEEVDKPNIGYKKRSCENKSLTQEYIYTRIQEFLKENDILICETGIVPYGISPLKVPNNVTIEFQMLWGSIGWATPATLGACIAKPQSRVILITGEGAHLASAMEIGTMLKMGIKPVIIVINNDGYTIERYLSQNSNDSFNDIPKMNYSKFARTFEGDVWATKILTDEDFDKALKVTQIMNKMCYLEITTESMDIPALAKTFISDSKKQNDSEPVTTIFKPEVTNYEEFAVSSDSFNNEYETTVHKKFTTNEED